ncbi:unnamed protein product [Orchesella dallaii]|uniref:Uncharacterized protein n=1 Tax=Orchesella dallaii TaxID=48710 RepID=A0ABP1PV69_9HEXA
MCCVLQNSQFLVQTGNAVIEKLPTVTFLFDGIPMQHRSTGQYLLGVADSIVDKSQTFCNPEQPLHYKLRIKIRQILLSAADIFETAGRALMNPGNSSDLSKKSEDSTASASRRRRLRSPVRRTVEKMKEDYGVPNSAEDDTDSIAVTPTPPLVVVPTKTSRGRGRGRGRGSGGPSRAKRPRTQSYS